MPPKSNRPKTRASKPKPETKPEDWEQAFQSLKKDFEALLADSQRLFHSFKDTDATKKIFELGKDRLTHSPLAAMLGSFALGVLVSWLVRRKN